MEEENSDNVLSDPSQGNIFAKYAYQGTPEKKPSLRKKKAVDLEEFEVKASASSPIKQQGGETKATKSAEEDTKPSQQQLGSKKVKMYHNLKGIDDHLEDGLDIIFCGINPGKQSAQTGHHYANPTNHFWSCLHASGLTSRKLDPREDHKLPKSFSMGLANLVDRPSVEQSELSKTEQIAGVSKLLQKISHFKPRLVCFVGLGIADVVRANCGLPPAPRTPKIKAEVGIQSYKMVHIDLNGTSSETLFFAVSSTSGRVVRYTKSDKIQQFKDLRTLLEKVKSKEFDSSHLTPVPALLPPPIQSCSETC